VSATTDALAGFTKEPFTAQGKTRDLYRIGEGPAVIVISEIPGITPLVASFARKVAERGLTAVLPHLFGSRVRSPRGGHRQGHGPICISRQFSLLALARTSPITVWLRALAAPSTTGAAAPASA